MGHSGDSLAPAWLPSRDGPLEATAPQLHIYPGQTWARGSVHATSLTVSPVPAAQNQVARRMLRPPARRRVDDGGQAQPGETAQRCLPCLSLCVLGQLLLRLVPARTRRGEEEESGDRMRERDHDCHQRTQRDPPPHECSDEQGRAVGEQLSGVDQSLCSAPHRLRQRPLHGRGQRSKPALGHQIRQEQRRHRRHERARLQHADPQRNRQQRSAHRDEECAVGRASVGRRALTPTRNQSIAQPAAKHGRQRGADCDEQAVCHCKVGRALRVIEPEKREGPGTHSIAAEGARRRGGQQQRGRTCPEHSAHRSACRGCGWCSGRRGASGWGTA
mmetsp:Transcript_10355/g.34268  ORF Transcript_10355/g.34268 Transcript_10355/m.34268 type:complete len:331 (+) Transcript_10355:80-1072(+)